jgi:hypothetical protein
MKKMLVLLGFLFLFISCTPTALIPTPSSTNTPLLTATSTPYPTKTPTPSPVWVTLGSPFAGDCGDGIPVVWSNDSYNGKLPNDYDSKMDDRHGHVDIMIPKGCLGNAEGLVIAPISGELVKYGHSYHLYVDKGEYVKGAEKAFSFIGIESIDPSKISQIYLNLAHFNNFVEGKVQKGQPFGNLVKQFGHWKISYQIVIRYKGISYIFSPTLFPTKLSDGTTLKPMLDGTSTNWTCAQDSYVKNYPNQINDCIPEPHDYAP